jgi:predicted porin
MAQVPGGVQLYGRLNLSFDNYEAKGAAAAGRDFDGRFRVADTASRVGLRGSEDLGNGFRAIFQIETGVNVDSGNNFGQNGIQNPNTGFWASRDSWVGIEGDRFGRLTFGRQSAYWANGTIEQIGANYINASSPLASYSQSGVVLGPVARESNTVQYSLRFGGFSATASYGHSATAVGSQSAYETAQAGVDPKDQFYALTLRYNHSVFDLQADFGTRQDIVTVPGRDFTGWKLGAAWKYMPGAQISLIYQNLKNDNTFGLGVANGLTPSAALTTAGVPAAFIPAIANGCGPVANTPGVPAAVLTAVQAGLFTTGGGGTIDRCADLKQDMWVISWEHTFGNFQALAQFGWADDVSGGNLPDSDVTTYLVGGRYFLSKRTWLYASWNQIKNGRNNFVDYWAGWMTSANTAGLAPGLPSTSSGADPQIIAIGIFHQF